ncbi:MAG: hypothetical protein IKI47_00020 [Prevotella sp.]|nr:hypothetical protein [Prevotella sp.]
MATYTITLNERTNSGKALMTYLRSLGVLIEKATPKKASRKDPTLLSKEEFFANIERAERQIERGEGIAFTDKASMNAWLNAL